MVLYQTSNKQNVFFVFFKNISMMYLIVFNFSILTLIPLFVQLRWPMCDHFICQRQCSISNLQHLTAMTYNHFTCDRYFYFYFLFQDAVKSTCIDIHVWFSYETTTYNFITSKMFCSLPANRFILVSSGLHYRYFCLACLDNEYCHMGYALPGYMWCYITMLRHTT